MTLLNAVGNLGTAFSGGTALIEFLTGSSGNQAVVSAIADLEATINDDLQALIGAVTDQTWQQQWSPFSSAIAGIQETTAGVAQEFNTVAKAGTGYTIDCGAIVPFDVWAAGGTYDGIAYGSSLQQLRTTAETLWEQFQVGGVLDESILGVWGSLFQLGSADIVQNLAGQTRLIAYFSMQQQIYGMLSTIFYLHEAILALYCETYGNQGNFSSLGNFVQTNFGDINTANSVWAQFEQVMAIWPPLLQDYQIIATSGDSFTGADAYYVINRGGGAPGGAQFWNQWTKTSQYPSYANAFFTGLQIVIDTSQSTDFPNYYLLGTLSTIGAGGAITVETEVTSYDASAATEPANIIYFNSESYGYVNVAYAAPPQPLPPGDYYNVITGFCITTVYGNRLALQLEYSQLDLTDANDPKVTLSGDADVTVGSYFGVGGNAYFNNPEINYIDLRPAGPSVPFPIDNVSLIQTEQTGSGNRIGLLVRSGWNVFQAVFMQPTSALVPNSYKQPAAVEG